MKKFFIFIVGLVIGIITFIVFCNCVKAYPSKTESVDTLVEEKIETPIEAKVETPQETVVEREPDPFIDFEEIKEEIAAENEQVPSYERNVKWVKAKAKIMPNGDVYVDFEGESYDILIDIGIEYRLFTEDGKYVILKHGYDNITDYVGNTPKGNKFHFYSRDGIPSSSVRLDDIDKVVGIEIYEISFKFANDEIRDEYEQTGYQKRFYNIEKVR